MAAAFRGDALARAMAAGNDAAGCPADALAGNEDYWSEIQRCFDMDRTIINLNNGGVSPCPSHVLEQMIRDMKFSNEAPARHMWAILEPRIESVRRDLAHEFGCDIEEIAITRNASEGMETLILGIDLNRGDEVIITDQNYPRMVTTWDQRARREGIVVKKILVPDSLARPRDIHRVRSRRDLAANQGYRVSTYHELLRTDLAGAGRGSAGTRERDLRLRRRRPLVRSLPVPARRSGVRLLCHQSA